MEDPRLVHRGLVGLGCVVAAASAALSLYLWDVHPLVVWMLTMVGIALGFVIVTGIHAVTVWPLVLLIAMVVDGRGKRRPADQGSAEPAAPADCDPDEPGSR